MQAKMGKQRKDFFAWWMFWVFCLLPNVVAAQATLIAAYAFDDTSWCSPATAFDSAGFFNGFVFGRVFWQDSPASGSKPVTGAAANFTGDGAIEINGLPFDLASGAQNSVTFWMYWDGTDNVMPLGFEHHDLWLKDGSFGFNTFNDDLYGISSAGLAHGWNHVAAIFTNGNVAANRLWINGIERTLTQRRWNSFDNSRAVVSPQMRLSGVWGAWGSLGVNGYQFRGALDNVRVYSGAITEAQVNADRLFSVPAVTCPVRLVAHYRLNDNWDVAPHQTSNAVAGGTAGTFLTPIADKVATPAVAPNKPDTCTGADFTPGKGSLRGRSSNIDRNWSGGRNSVTFWMYWRGQDNQMPFGFQRYALWLMEGHFGFNTGNHDVFGISSAGLANGWHHVAAVFVNGDVSRNKLWINGVPQNLTQRRSSPNNHSASASLDFMISGWLFNDNHKFHGLIDEIKVYRGEIDTNQVLRDMNASCHSLLAEWRMDEASWTGSPGEVKDSSGNGYHGQAGGPTSGSTTFPTTDGASPAIPGSPGTCRYGVFFRDNKRYVAIPGFPNLGSNSFTITAWFRTNDFKKSKQRIFSDWLYESSSKSYGYVFNINTGDGNQNHLGKLRFTIAHGVGQTSVFSSFTVENNQWYFGAAIYDTANKTIQIYLFDRNGNRLDYKSASFSSNIVHPPTDVVASIGREIMDWDTQGMDGNIDEVRVYHGVLSEFELKQIQQITRPCPQLDHIRIEAGTTGLTCQREAVTFKACANATCSTLYAGGNVQINLSPAGQWYAAASGGPPLVGAQTIPPSGVLTLYLQQSTPTTVAVNATHAGGPAPTGSPAVTCNNDTTAAPCHITFADAGLIFTATQGGSEATIPNQTAGVEFSYFLRAVKSDKTTGACVAAVQGTRSVTFGYTCVDPATCAAGSYLTVNGGGLAQNLTFDANGSTIEKVQFNYRDVGKIRLTATTTSATNGVLSGASNDFIVKPYGFRVRACTGAIPCPDDNDSRTDGTGPVFVQAGELFKATITAVAKGNTTQLKDGTPTPSFGLGTGNDSETVVLTHSRVAPTPGQDGALGGTKSITRQSFSDGVANVSDLTWSEVGVMTLTATNTTFLGIASSTTGTSGAIGRFIPHHFVTEVTPGCGGFTYSGQPFGLKITARNKGGGGTTENYAGSFARTVTLSDAGSIIAGNLTPTSVAASSFSAGVAGHPTPLNVRYDFVPLKTGAPHILKVRAVDTDGVSSADGVPPSEGTTVIRAGRLVLFNAHGSELLPLTMPIQTQYWTGSAWVTNTLDSCTNIASSLVLVKNPTTLPSPTGGAITNGKGQLVFSAPNAKGTVQVCANIGSDSDNPITGCRTGTSHPWLQGSWDSDNQFNDNPWALATFGVYQGRSPIIYRRERY